MTLVMAYVILISAVFGAGAVLLEAVALRRGVGTRWVWVLAMACTIAATLFAMVAPRQAVVEIATHEDVKIGLLTLSATTSLSSSVQSADAAETAIAVADSVLPVAWVITTLVLLAALAIGQRRFRLERRNARKANIGGHDVLLTEHLGPAVAGVRRPVVFVPRWVLALDGTSQQLLLAHELEHVKQRDTTLLLFGAVTAAMTPWNPIVWWMVRRLRLAVEQDCDARVLATHPGVRRYADLLLTAASRHGLASRLLAAHFGEYTSDLVRRIEAMTSKSIPWRRIAAASFLATALGAAACEAPRPDPVAPLPAGAPVVKDQEVPVNAERSTQFDAQITRCTEKIGPGCLISVVVQSSEGEMIRTYFGEIPVAHLPEDGVEKLKVEQASCGENSCSLIWITLKPGVKLPTTPLPTDKSALRGSDVVEVKRRAPTLIPSAPPALRHDETSDALVEVAKQSDGVVKARLVERDGQKYAEGTGEVSWPPRIMLRNGAAPQDPPNVVITAKSGMEVRRILASEFRAGSKSPLDEIRSEDIESIEVRKGSTCAPLGCPLVHIMLKAGREGAYRKP